MRETKVSLFKTHTPSLMQADKYDKYDNADNIIRDYFFLFSDLTNLIQNYRKDD